MTATIWALVVMYSYGGMPPYVSLYWDQESCEKRAAELQKHYNEMRGSTYAVVVPREAHCIPSSYAKDDVVRNPA